ncbi:MAG: hypothetical protein OXI79_04925 [Gammaproteobacteria bacterium]|nr:hypothetical protein [Gammaproteobacteria bacterium]
MKSYVLVGGGLLIGVVLLHALISAWRANRPVPNEDSEDFESDVLMEGEDVAELLWDDDAAEEPAVPMVEETVHEEEPGPPVLMEPTTASNEEATHADAVTEQEAGDAPASLPEDETVVAQTMESPQTEDDGPEMLRKGRRIDIPGKRTEPTVPRAMRPEFHEFTPRQERNEPRDEPNVPESLDEVIVVWLFARPGRRLDGEALLKMFVSHGLKCDADRVFKKSDPRCGGLWYTVANGVEPGSFDISRPAALETPGIVMLLSLGQVRDPGTAFEDMLDVAQDLAISLDAELKDERMSDMSAQTIEHCRQRIRDHRRMLLRA